MVFEKTCAQCGKNFTSTRHNGRFCSIRCRSKSYHAEARKRDKGDGESPLGSDHYGFGENERARINLRRKNVYQRMNRIADGIRGNIGGIKS